MTEVAARILQHFVYSSGCIRLRAVVKENQFEMGGQGVEERDEAWSLIDVQL